MADADWDFDLEDIRCRYLEQTGCPGTFAMVATWQRVPGPIAIVWYRFPARKDELEIINSWVQPAARRRGVRSKINAELFDGYAHINRIITMNGSNSGAAWMRATGYRQTPTHWYVTRRQWQLAQKRRKAA